MDLISTGLINKWRLLLQFYKQVGLTESELVLVMIVMHLSTLNKRFITPDAIVKYSNFTTADVDIIFTNLKNKGFIQLDENIRVGTEMSLTPLFRRLMEIMYKMDDINVVTGPLNSIFKNIINRDLTPTEINVITDIVVHKISLSYLEDEANKITGKLNFNDLIDWIKQLVSSAPRELTKFNWIDS